jgi:uncharacterized membrane protein YhaH (DUF805 family)
MSSNAYYIAQAVIIIAIVLVAAGAAGFEAIGEIFQPGILFGIGGIVMIMFALSLIFRRYRHH